MIMIIEKGDQGSVSRCSTCNQENTAITDPNSGEIVCSNCGMVISDKIDDDIHPERGQVLLLLWLAMIWDFLQLLERRTKMPVDRK
jgi:DNA-directed RNA polymerase subunit RPC12/RpoP